MKKSILFVNSRGETEYLLDFFNELMFGAYDFCFLESDNIVLKKMKEKNWQCRKIKKRDNVSLLGYFFFWPFVFFRWSAFLLYFKYKKSINHIVLSGIYEKLVFTPIAVLLGIKVIWLEFPSRDLDNASKLLIRLLKYFSRRTTLATFTDFYKKKLEMMGFKNIFNIGLGINLSNYAGQDNIFESLAKNGYNNSNKKFFTVGTVLVMDDMEKVEIMFQAVKKCLTVIPHLQFIVIGDGEKRKNFFWLAKRMEIDTLSWFVGKKDYLKKWFDGFDIFCHPQDHIDINNLTVMIQALASNLPIVGPNNIGLEDIFYKKEQIITVDPEKAEDLAQEIIRVYKNKYIYKKIANRKEVCALFSTEKMAKEFNNIIHPLNLKEAEKI